LVVRLNQKLSGHGGRWFCLRLTSGGPTKSLWRGKRYGRASQWAGVSQTSSGHTLGVSECHLDQRADAGTFAEEEDGVRLMSSPGE